MSSLANRLGRYLPLLLTTLCFSPQAPGFGRAERQALPWKNSPEKFILNTGIPCIYQKDTTSPTTVVGLFVGGGKSAVPSGLDGLAAIATRILLEIPDDGKVRDLMAQATQLSFICLEDCSIILVECLTEHLEEAVQVAAKIVQDPLISGLRVGRAKDLMTAHWKAEADDAVAAARAAVLSAFFGGLGYGSALYGTDASLEAIDRKDVLAFIRRFFVKPNILFCVETDLEWEPVRRLLEGSFDAMPEGPAPELPLQVPILPDDRDITLVMETKQTYVGRAYALPRAGLVDMARGMLLETLLGKGPGSRLWALRADERLAYGVDADLTWTKSSGILIAYLESGRPKSQEAAAALDRTLAALREAGVTEEEMEATRTMAKARFLRAAEMKSPRLRTLGLFEILEIGHERAAKILQAIDAVTRNEMNAFIREVLSPDRALSVTVGQDTSNHPQGESPCPN